MGIPGIPYTAHSDIDSAFQLYAVVFLHCLPLSIIEIRGVSAAASMHRDVERISILRLFTDDCDKVAHLCIAEGHLTALCFLLQHLIIQGGLPVLFPYLLPVLHKGTRIQCILTRILRLLHMVYISFC